MMEDISLSLSTVELPSSDKNGDATRPSSTSAIEGAMGTGTKVFSATLCCYTACDLADPMVCCRGKSDGLCFNTRACIDPSADGLGIGILDEETDASEMFKAGAHCCTCALKKPEPMCASAGRLLCMKSARSIPFDSDYVEGPICACCFLQCFPTIGCLEDAPECPALDDGLAGVGGGTVTTLWGTKVAVVRSRKMDR